MEVRIGTSGWHYKHWRGPVYPRDLPPRRMLAHYLADFDTVELNNSFYHLPALSCVQNWRDATPPGFCFAVKGSRFMTHMKKLKDPEAGIARFLPVLETFGEKVGPVLFQLPPRWACNEDRLEAFLKALPARYRYVFELRDPSWHVPKIYRILSAHNAAFCIYELAGFQSPVELTADLAYVRLHGPGRKKYQGDYSTKTLKVWADRIASWRRTLSGVYVYFDNDQAGYAYKNARELKRMVE